MNTTSNIFDDYRNDKIIYQEAINKLINRRYRSILPEEILKLQEIRDFKKKDNGKT